MLNKKEINIMFIHTFETTKILTNKEYFELQNELKKDNNWKSENSGMLYFGLSDKGIIIRMHYIKKKDYHTYNITYRISAHRVLHNNDYVNLFNVNKYKKLEKVVNDLLEEKTKLFPKLANCSLKRIDFCFNALLDNREQVKAYIRLLKRGDAPSKMKVRTEKNNMLLKDGFTVYNKNTVEISIYDKYKQMKKENDKKTVFSNEDLKRAKNILRIEIRCQDKKIKEFQKKYKIFTIEEFFEYADKIGHELFTYYLPKFFGSGQIYTLSKLKEEIKISEYRKPTIEFMEEFVSYCNSIRRGFLATEEFNNIYGKDKVKRIKEKFDEIEASYITIPRRDMELFKFGLPTLMELYNEFSN